MAHGGRQNADDALAAAVAAGRTAREAATSAGVSERTAFRRLTDPAFKTRVRSLRADMVGGATGRMADALGASADVLRELLADSDPHLRFKAAAKVVDLALRLRELTDLSDEVADLTRRLDELDGATPGTDG